MTFTLDPALPLIWHTPTTVAVGVDDPVVIEDVGVVEERVLHALQTGSTREGLDVITGRRGASPSRAELLLDRLSGVIRTGDSIDPPLGHARIAAMGLPTPSRAMLSLVQHMGATAFDLGALSRNVAPAQRPDVVLIAASFVVSPAHSAFWLRRDIPHLPVVFGDRRIRIGPWVHPGHGPCLHCVERARIDADPTWPAQACQLLGKPAATADALGLACVLPVVAQWCLDRLRPGTVPPTTHTSLVLDPRTGASHVEKVTEHPECCCRALRETGTADARDSESHRSSPTTA